MILIIDGYNVLKQHGAHRGTERDRDQFIVLLQKYARVKGHAITVVFDGGATSWPEKQMRMGMSIVYAGTASTADTYIKRILYEVQHQEVLLITTDRALNHAADDYGIPSLDSADFITILNDVIAAGGSVPKHDHDIRKTTQSVCHELDELMRLSVKNVSPKDSDCHHRPATHSITSGSLRLTKHEKKLVRLLRKL